MHLFYKSLTCCVILQCCLLSFFSVAQTDNVILHPFLHDSYVGYQILPDDGIRIVSIADHNLPFSNQQCNITDYHVPDPISAIETRTLLWDNVWFNAFIWQLNMIPLIDGSTILSNSQFDCDYDPPGGLIKIDSAANVEWLHDFFQDGSYRDNGRMVFTNATSFYVYPNYWQNEGYYGDLEGNLTEGPAPFDPYTYTLQTSYGFVASREDQLFLLHPHFQHIRIFDTQGEIRSISPLGNDQFIIKTEDTFYFLREDATLEVLPFSVDTYSLIWPTASYFYAVDTSLSQLIRMDTFFTALDTMVLQPEIKPIAGVAFDSTALLLARYETPQHNNILLFKGDENNFFPTLDVDIGVSEVEMDGIVYEKLYIEFSVYYYYTISNLRARVTNFSADTIDRFVLQLSTPKLCVYCGERNYALQVDTLLLAPEESAWIDLSQIDSGCGYTRLNEICIAAFAPNDQADGDFTNNTYCHPFDTVFISSTQPIHHSEIKIFPNPAADEVWVHNLSTHRSLSRCSIFSPEGILVQSCTINGDITAIPFNNLHAGIYLIRIEGSDGTSYVEKLLIQD